MVGCGGHARRDRRPQLLAGQSWFDLTQYRLNPPDGVVTHWSQLIDLPLALLIKAGTLVVPAALAERIALTLWPTALLLVFFIGVMRLARELAAAHAIDYVAFCPGTPERYDYVAWAPAGLAAALGRGDVPAFLERIPLAGSDLTVYRVRW